MSSSYSGKTPLQKAQYTNDTKDILVDNLLNKGFNIESTDSFRDIATAIGNNTSIVNTETNNAASSNEILLGKVAFANGQQITGTLTNATTSTDGLMSKEDKSKLNGISANANVNTIETIKVNGTALVPDANKAVNINLSTDVIRSRTFTTSDNWSALDTSGHTTLELTISDLNVPVVVRKLSSLGGYENIMVDLRYTSNGTVYIKSDAKFEGILYYFGSNN